MYKKIVINVTSHETRVALLEDGTIVELFVERKDETNITGNFYKGRVQRVLPGMQAAFVDIGLNQAAFLYVNDVNGSHFLRMEERLFAETANEEPFFENGFTAVDIPSESTRDDYDQRGIPIEDLIKEGQEILVQIAKAPLGTKGARVTSYVSIPGRYLVLVPDSDHIGISRKIVDETERTRLKEMVLALRKDNLGYIVRTASEGIQAEKLAYEMEFLNNLWQNIQNKYKTAPAQSLLHSELNVILRAVRDLLIQDAERLIIDSKQGYESVIAFLDEFSPGLKDSVDLYEGSEPIFDVYNIEGDISRALKRKVWLKSGGYLMIEQTEALVAIDVNTGRYVGKHNLEETILNTNLEAVKEIAYQIRLRDIGGIIIIDFIDMSKKANQEKVYQSLLEALKRDRSKTSVLPMSELGLVQMTRKRTRKPLNRILCEPCFYCEGEGFLISKESISYNIYRELRREAMDSHGTRLTLRVNPQIADLLLREENHAIAGLEQKTGTQIVIFPEPKFHMEQFDIVEQAWP